MISRLGLRRPVLLVIDGAKVHLLIYASEFCDKHNIILYTLYPNSTHLLQPLDLSLMGLAKVQYKNTVQEWIQAHPFEAYDKFSFRETFKVTWNKAATVENAAKGFKVVGLYPFNPASLDQRKLYAAELTANLDPSSIADASVTEDPEPTTPTAEPQPSTSTAEPQLSTSTAEPQLSTSTAQQEPRTSMKSLTPGTIVFGGQRFELVPMENSPTEAKPAPMTKEVLDDVLEVPKVKKDDKKRSEGWWITASHFQ